MGKTYFVSDSQQAIAMAAALLEKFQAWIEGSRG
jgi:hypothetical protein